MPLESAEVLVSMGNSRSRLDTFFIDIYIYLFFVRRFFDFKVSVRLVSGTGSEAVCGCAQYGRISVNNQVVFVSLKYCIPDFSRSDLFSPMAFSQGKFHAAI